MTDKIIVEQAGPVARLIFNNPERRNAVSLEMWRRVEATLAQLAADPDLRAVVVSGAGDKAFVSGADVSKFESERAGREAVAEYNVAAERAYGSLQDFPKPTIAMIRGACIGGGVNLAVCCDLRLAAESARFAVPAAKLGLGYGLANVGRLASVVGAANAMEMLYTARRLDAEEAMRIGLVNRVVPDDQLEAVAQEYATTIAGNAPLTIATVKAAVTELGKDPARRDAAKLQQMVEACFGSQDYVEGRRAFMQKRTPKFTGT